MGVAFCVQAADIDESATAGESALQHVQRLAAEKAQTIAKLRQDALPVLAADTIVVCDNAILGKPKDDAQAYTMLQALSGREHDVYTALALAHQGQLHAAISHTRVSMGAMQAEDIRAYIASGQARDKAGAYGIQGAASVWIQRIDGSHSGVMGLPIYDTVQLLRQAQIYPTFDW